MLKKILFFIFIFYILVLIQTSFLVHFKVWGIFSNFVLLAVIFINIFGLGQQQKTYSALIGGFYLDVFSLESAVGFFGFYTLVLFLFSFLLRVILEKYLRFSINWTYDRR